jgi:hypothetical protein
MNDFAHLCLVNHLSHFFVSSRRHFDITSTQPKKALEGISGRKSQSIVFWSFANLLNYGNVQLRPTLSLTVSSRQVVIFAAAAGTFAVAIVFLANFVQQSSRTD